MFLGETLYSHSASVSTQEKVGYQETATVETKFEEAESSKLDDREYEDEKPTVVLGSNVSEAEADAFITRLKAEEDANNKEEEKRKDATRGDSTEDAGKIVFKKPSKRKSNDSEKDLNSKADDRKKSKPTSTMKSVKNKSLLSFDEEEDEN